MERYIFDLDGTLLNANWEEENIFFEELLGSNAKKFNQRKRSILLEYEKFHYKYDINSLSNYFISQGENITPEIIKKWCYFNGNFISDKIIEDSIETLEYLKSHNKKISLLTNWFSETQIKRLERAKMLEYFDTLICGDTVLKPNEDSYIKAAQKTPLDKCLMIGDTIEKDYYGAIKAGMNAYLIDNNNSLAKVKTIGGKK